MFKNKYSDEILAISIPKEFASKFVVSSTVPKKTQAQIKRINQKEEEVEKADAIYAKNSSSNVTTKTTPLSPTKPPVPKRVSSGKPRYTGDPSVGKGAIQKAGYQCENNTLHTTFAARSTGQQFMEPHHLIPISSQNLFSSNIDIT